MEARPVFPKRRRASVEFFPDELLRILSEEGVEGCAWSRERGGAASGARGWLTSPEVEEKRRRMVRTPASKFSSLAARFEEEAEGKNCGGGGVYKGVLRETNRGDFALIWDWNRRQVFGCEIFAGG